MALVSGGTPEETIRTVFPAELEAWALRVGYCESGLNPMAWNDWGYGHYGIYQISGIHAYRWADFWDNWDDARRNAEMALELVLEQGAQIWQCQ